MFTKTINPIFTVTVDIPVPGQAPDPVEFQFHYLDAAAFDALVTEINERKITVMDACHRVVAGWNHPAVAFTPEKLDECFKTFPGSPLAIWTTFRASLFEGKRKNF